MATLEPGVNLDKTTAPADADQLYRYDVVADFAVDDFDAITDDHIEAFRDLGYLVVRRAFDPEKVREALDGFMYLLDGANPDFDGVQLEPDALYRV